jgi:hypothetical protein
VESNKDTHCTQELALQGLAQKQKDILHRLEQTQLQLENMQAMSGAVSNQNGPEIGGTTAAISA